MLAVKVATARRHRERRVVCAWVACMPLPVFVINLDRRPDRWRVVLANLDRIGLHAIRIDAIDGYALTDDVALRLMGPGHVGCARSHYKAYSALLASHHPSALILEDDVEVGASIPAIIRSVAWWPDGHGTVKLTSPADAETLYCLGHSIGHTPCGRALRPILRKSLGAYGYLINRDTADLILKTMPDIPVPIDHMLFNMVDSAIARAARPLQLMPAAIRHRPYQLVGSDTASTANSLLKNVLGRKPWKENEAVRLYRKASWARAVLTGSAQFLQVPYRD